MRQSKIDSLEIARRERSNTGDGSKHGYEHSKRRMRRSGRLQKEAEESLRRREDQVEALVVILPHRLLLRHHRLLLRA